MKGQPQTFRKSLIKNIKEENRGFPFQNPFLWGISNLSIENKYFRIGGERLAARIRLQRFGRKNRPFYRVVVADSRAARDGKFIEKLGNYNPLSEPIEFTINEERALYWLQVGAQPSNTVKSLLSRAGIWARFMNQKQTRNIESEEEVASDILQSEALTSEEE